jgi:hypothetical protein
MPHPPTPTLHFASLSSVIWGHGIVPAIQTLSYGDVENSYGVLLHKINLIQCSPTLRQEMNNHRGTKHDRIYEIAYKKVMLLALTRLKNESSLQHHTTNDA